MTRITVNATAMPVPEAMENLLGLLHEWHRTYPDLRVTVLVSDPQTAFSLRLAGFGNTLHLLPRMSGIGHWFWETFRLSELLKRIGTDVYMTVPTAPIYGRAEPVPGIALRAATVLPAA